MQSNVSATSVSILSKVIENADLQLLSQYADLRSGVEFGWYGF
jgi:hypothetical protein